MAHRNRHSPPKARWPSARRRNRAVEGRRKRVGDEIDNVENIDDTIDFTCRAPAQVAVVPRLTHGKADRFERCAADEGQGNAAGCCLARKRA